MMASANQNNGHELYFTVDDESAIKNSTILFKYMGEDRGKLHLFWFNTVPVPSGPRYKLLSTPKWFLIWTLSSNITLSNPLIVNLSERLL